MLYHPTNLYLSSKKNENPLTQIFLKMNKIPRKNQIIGYLTYWLAQITFLDCLDVNRLWVRSNEMREYTFILRDPSFLCELTFHFLK